MTTMTIDPPLTIRRSTSARPAAPAGCQLLLAPVRSIRPTPVPVLDHRWPARTRPAAAAPARGAAGRPVQLTRRGRLALVLTVAGLLLLAFSVGRSSTTPTATAAAVGVARQAVVVQPGDTLWRIAARVAPGVDPRSTIEVIRRLNHLPSPVLTPGQPLRVPAR